MSATALATERSPMSDRIIDEARGTPVTTGSTLVLRSAEGTDNELPADLQRVLLHTLASNADDNQVAIGRMPEELTSTITAELLGVSRPTLKKRTGAGEIGSFTVGSHTRLQRDEVLRVRALRASKHAAAHEALREFGAEQEELFDD